MLRRHIVLFVAIRPSDGELKPGGPLVTYRQEWLHCGTGFHLLPSLQYLPIYNRPTVTLKTVTHTVTYLRVDSGGPVVIILASGSEVRGFDLGRGRWIIYNLKMLSMTSFGREVKQWVPFLRFTARKKNLNLKLEPLSKICRIFMLTIESDANDLRC